MGEKSPYPEGRGEVGDFSDIVRRHNASLNAFVFHILQDMDAAADVVQETFLALWLNWDKVDFNLSLRNFIYVTARNFAYKYLRTKKRFDNNIPVIPGEELISAYIVREEAIRLLKDAIGKLPERTAEVIRLSLDGMPQEKIAERMNVSVANIKKLKAIGIVKLKDAMGPFFSVIACIAYC